MASAVASSGPDTQPPSAPGTLTASVVSAGEIDLSWGAATDNVGVTGIPDRTLQRSGLQQLRPDHHRSPERRSTTPLSPPRPTTPTASAPWTPPATSAPTPTPRAEPLRRSTASRRRSRGLCRRAQSGAGEIDLSWGAATDNVGVTGYRIERCSGVGCNSFAQIATATGTTYKDTSVAASTSYTYRVRATDAAGNLGAYSNTATVSTPAAPLGPGGGVRVRRGLGDDGHRRLGQRQQRHGRERHLGDGRRIRPGDPVQRHEHARQHPRRRRPSTSPPA